MNDFSVSSLKTLYGHWRLLFDQAVAHLQSRIIERQQLDEWQISGIDLAYACAELAAMDSCLSYLDRLETTGQPTSRPLVRGLALQFIAERLQRLIALTVRQSVAWNLSQPVLLRVISESQEFVSQQSDSQLLNSLADELMQRGPAFQNSLLPDDVEALKVHFDRVADDVLKPIATDIHCRDLTLPDSLLDTMRELGLFGLTVPQVYGGSRDNEREDILSMVVVTEALARGSLCAGGGLITRPEIFTRAILAGATKAQQQRWLPQIAKGEPLGAVAVTEPDFGSDVAGIRLRAQKVEGGWLMNGVKSWSTFAGKAGALLLLARSEPDHRGHKGLSLFWVEKPGFDGHEFEHQQPQGGTLTGQATPTLGYRGMHSFELFFDDYFVPDADLIGEERGRGKGFYYMMAGFSGGRIQTAARACGIMQAAYEEALGYAHQRRVFGKTLAEYPLSKAKLVQQAAAVLGCQQFTYRVAKMLEEGEGQMEASLVKLFACRLSESVTRDSQQIHGGMGYAEETTAARLFVDARVLSIFEGAEETLALKVVFRDLIFCS